MTVYKAKFNKVTLETLPARERSLFLALAHLANEIRALEKLVLWSGQLESQNDAQVSGQTSLMFMFLKLLAGKLKEGHKLLQKGFFGTGISRDYKLSKEAQDALGEIKNYFDRRNTIHRVRNKFAFHYSPDEMDRVLPGLPDELEVYIQEEGSANNLYYFAEVLANRALLRSIQVEDDQNAYHQLMEEIVKVTHWFTIVCDALMTEFLRRHIDGIWEGHAEEVSFNDLPLFQSVQIPWFTDTSGLSLDKTQ
jgi:hypothetical protein